MDEPKTAGKARRRLPDSVKWAVGVIVTVALVVAAGIVARDSVGGADARSKLTIIAPAAAGGGWDLVARETQQALRANSIVNNANVVNVPGAGGTIGLDLLSESRGDGARVMVTGTVMMGGIARNKPASNLADMTPIARLAEDFEVIAVPAHSPYRTLDEFIEAWRRDPRGMPIGGGSAGGIDHMVAAMLAREAGIPLGDVQYDAKAGGGELTLDLISEAANTPNAGISGYNDFRDLLETGRLRALVVIAPERLEGLDAPTAAEAGYPGVDIVNWRGYVAPPGLSEAQRDELIEITREMVSTDEWQSAVARNRWEENWLEGDAFRQFLIDEQKEIDALMKDLGLT